MSVSAFTASVRAGRRVVAFAAILAVGLALAPAAAHPSTAAAGGADPPVQLPDLGTGDYDAARLGDAIRRYHSSGRWARDRRAVGRRAIRHVRRRARALRRRDGRGIPGIVLDVDDTSLSHYRVFEQLDFMLDRSQLAVAFVRADAPAIRPTLALYRLAHRLSVRVFFITGRPEGIREFTALNLRRAGYRGNHGLFMRPDDDSRRSVVPFKSGVRRRLERRGFRIVANVGDQDSDLEGGHAERGFRLPNPMYFLR